MFDGPQDTAGDAASDVGNVDAVVSVLEIETGLALVVATADAGTAGAAADAASAACRSFLEDLEGIAGEATISAYIENIIHRSFKSHCEVVENGRVFVR
jgi:hypothetical protein